MLNRLPRRTAGDLPLLAVLVPVIVTNLAADPPQEVYSSDAPPAKALASDFKGSSVLLDKASSPHPPPGLGDEADREDEPCGPQFDGTDLSPSRLRAVLTALKCVEG